MQQDRASSIFAEGRDDYFNPIHEHSYGGIVSLTLSRATRFRTKGWEQT
jgi:hypothetical protein